MIGSAGPTSSYRMDGSTPLLLEKGLKGMIGKGRRSQTVIDAIHASGAVYFVAAGGAELCWEAASRRRNPSLSRIC